MNETVYYYKEFLNNILDFVHPTPNPRCLAGDVQK